MESEPTENSSYLPATSPKWAAYYQRAKVERRLGKGEHNRIQSVLKRRRRQANLIAVGSTALLAVIVAICAALLG
jgi:hypothetical protein